MLGGLDDDDAFVKVSSLRARLFSGRAAADYDEIEIFVRSQPVLLS
jgi:hypothetical protein